jgi:hypothetical protein
MSRDLCHNLRFTAHLSCITAAGPCPYFLDASSYVDHPYQIGDLVWEVRKEKNGEHSINAGTIEGFAWMGEGPDEKRLAVRVRFKSSKGAPDRFAIFQPRQFGVDIFTSRGDAQNREMAESRQIDGDTLMRAREITAKYDWTPGLIKKLLKPAFEIENPVNKKGSKMKLYRERDVIIAMLSDEYKEAKKESDKRVRRSQAQVNHRIETSLAELRGETL